MLANPLSLGLLVVSMALALPMSRATAAPVIGEPMPAFTATTVAGDPFDLAKLRGKVVLIHYWATWCEPCRHEMPWFDTLYRRYREQGLEIVAISIDRGADIETARKLASSWGYPSVVAPGVTVNELGRPTGVPMTYVIDTNGILRDTFNETTDKLFADVVLPMLPK